MRPKFAHVPIAKKDIEPFQSGEDAWFWFVRCQRLRDDRVQPISSMGTLARPCDPDDIYRAVKRLYKQHLLSAAHLRILSQYGLAERAPDKRCSEEIAAARLWEEAIALLEQLLKAKGIVALSQQNNR